VVKSWCRQIRNRIVERKALTILSALGKCSGEFVGRIAVWRNPNPSSTVVHC